MKEPPSSRPRPTPKGRARAGSGGGRSGGGRSGGGRSGGGSGRGTGRGSGRGSGHGSGNGSGRPPRRTTRRSRRPRVLRLGRPQRRLRVGLLVIAFIMSVFAGRLVQLQGIDASGFAEAAARERIQNVVLHASRGDITDVNGVSLATTVDTIAVTADPTMTRDDAVDIAHALAGVLHEPAGDLKKKLTKPDTRFVYLARHVKSGAWSQVTSQMDKIDAVGVFKKPDPLRTYPAHKVAANILGFVGADGTGLSGLEYALEGRLKGTDGKQTYQVGEGGSAIPLAPNTERDPVPGSDVRLTIDRDLQWVAQRALAKQVEKAHAESGDAVVIDLKTGEIRALATTPTFDPNEPTDSPQADRRNRPLQDAYEPGSVAKVLTAAAAIDGGYVTPRTKEKVPGYLIRNGERIGDYWGHGLIHLTFAGAIAKSSNIGTVLAAERMPAAEQLDYLRDFGLGKPTGIDFPGSNDGSLPSKDELTPLRRATISFGQGMSVNAVQLAAAVGAVANGGIYVEPTLIKGYVGPDGKLDPNPPAKRHRVVSEETARKVTNILQLVPETLATKAQIPGYQVAGKTGTAQRFNPTCSCYRGYTASFVGYAPADNPRFLVSVDVQDPQGDHSGSGNGAPVFHDIMSFALQKYRVPPNGASAPDLPQTW